MTEAGLNTVNLSQLALAQQIILFLLVIIGSSIFVSVSTVWTRKRVFENRFRGVVKGSKRGRFRGGILGRGGEGGGNGIGEVSVGERLEEQRSATKAESNNPMAWPQPRRGRGPVVATESWSVAAQKKG